jgi:glycyl-tRNA synthetase beta chain
VPEFLLEVGCEELPAGWLAGVSRQLGQRFEEAAAREHLGPSNLRVCSTPRRLVVCAEVLDRQPDREERLWGPSLKVARDAAGKWTGAAQGFARKGGVSPDALQQAPKDPKAPDDLYVFLAKQTPGRPAVEVLADVLAVALRGVGFPKRMSWDAWLDDGKGAFPFGRPIRWLVALLDGQVVPFTIFAAAAGGRGDPIVRSGDRSYGHRFLPRASAGEPFRVRSYADLEQRLRERCVLLDPAAREARIAGGLAPAADGAPAGGDGLVAEWRDLVEHPSVVIGRIPEEFRSLPVEVLETVLEHHQKYLPLAEAGVVSRFAAVTDSDGASAATIVRGMERVVVARLRDAAFFLAEDLKRPLAERAADLAGVTFHQKLGTYHDKALRLVALVEAMGAQPGVLRERERDAAREAAGVAKADLTTLMVREFPELQGVIGGLYLRAEGRAGADVAQAVRWHYHPLSVEEGSEPAGALGAAGAKVFAAVSLADKLDTLAGYFGIAPAPSGSSDPFGLRRAAQGAIRVLLDFWPAGDGERRPSPRALVAAAVAGYGGRPGRPGEEVRRELEAFLLDRLRYVLAARGYPADEVEAVLAAREPDALEDPHEAALRLRALHAVRQEASEDFEHLAVAFKRAKNILGADPAAPVDSDLFREEAERELHTAVGRLSRGQGGYESRLRSLAGLRAPVDRFFDDVLVMAEDARLRANRLGLLSEALALFYRIADISRLAG